jgi:LacI family transcriptional regulator
LTKPVGILASNDIPARDLAEMCRQVGLRVPDEVALVGVDNDRLQCGLAFPPLSSVAIPAERIGYEAARLLDRLMSGRRPPKKPLLLSPLHVVTRQSTDTVAIDDRDVATALTFVRHHAAENVTVAAVAKCAGVGRRVLERKFRSLLGTTVLTEIRRTRVQYAKELLSHTDLPIQLIATRTGFSGPQRLSLAFRQITGMAPSEYRRRSQVHETGLPPQVGGTQNGK